MNSTLLDVWHQVYELAVQIEHMAPWTMLDRSALIGVEAPHSGDVGFVSVTDDPTFPTISVYREARGLYGFWYSHDMPLADYPEQYLEIPQLQITLKPYAALESEDQRLVSQLGLPVHPSQTYPVIRSVQPGYRPWYLEDEEVNFLLVVLEQAQQMLPRAMLDPMLLNPQPPDRFPVRVQNPDGKSWRDDLIRIPQPGPEPILHRMDKPLFEKVKRLPHNQRAVEVDFFLVTGIPSHPSEAGQRPRYPYLLLMVDATLGLILGQETLSVSPTLETMIGLLGWKLVVQFDKAGAIPRTVLVRSPY